MVSLLQGTQNLTSRRWCFVWIVTLPSLVKRTQIYLFCKFGRLVKLSPSVLRKAGVQCICVCRPLDMEKNTLQLDTRWAGLVTIVEDSAMISADSEATTSSRVRQHLISGRNLKHTLSAPVYKYIFEHRLPNKVYVSCLHVRGVNYPYIRWWVKKNGMMLTIRY
jgi:hypothetical protein